MRESVKENLRALGFQEQVDRAEAGRCCFCNKPISPNDFKDTLSIKEFRVSGMCQRCQDVYFADEHPELVKGDEGRLSVARDVVESKARAELN